MKTINGLQVECTKDYFMFKTLDGNRNVNQLNKAKLKESFKKNYLLSPIIVNEYHEIIDGQHRFEAAQELNLPIYYIKVEGYGLKEVQVLNANQKNWLTDDYVDGYISLGKKHYETYRYFRRKYKLPAIQTIELLTGAKQGGRPVGAKSVISDFKQGEFKAKNIAKCEELFVKIVSFKDYYEGYKRKTFVAAMTTLLNKDEFSYKEFIDKLNLQPSAIVDCVNTKAYIELIERIYNHRRRNKVNLRF